MEEMFRPPWKGQPVPWDACGRTLSGLAIISVLFVVHWLMWWFDIAVDALPALLGIMELGLFVRLAFALKEYAGGIPPASPALGFAYAGAFLVLARALVLVVSIAFRWGDVSLGLAHGDGDWTSKRQKKKRIRKYQEQ